MAGAIEELSLSGQAVLLTMAGLALADETPAHTGQIVRATTEHLDSVEIETVGTLGEAEANRALNRLEAEGFVEMTSGDRTSPVGKGRPAYVLSTDTRRVLETLADEAVAPLAEEIAEKVR